LFRKHSSDHPKQRIFAYPCDVRDPHSVDELFRMIRREFHRLDLLVNNAGIAHPNLPVEKLPFPIWKDVLATNLDGTFLVTQAALAIMKRGATIVSNLSVAANRVFPGLAAYNASKHGALGFNNTLREELRPRGIRVIGLLAGATDTDIWKILWPEAPRRKMMSPETVAQAVIDVISLPQNATVENIEILPSVGTL
jgi:NAD(P)-dependent dehydrogenase (short-subunit alcohol dehydrogenase family)